jgi:hypothetical protein
MTRDFTTFVERLLTPHQPRLEAARAAVIGAVDAETAWKHLAASGVIPADWVGGSRRTFFGVPCPTCTVDERGDTDLTDLGCSACVASSWEFDHPRNVAACLTFAANPDGVLQAEALATEATRRLRSWGEEVGDPLQWQVESRGAVLERGLRRPSLAVVHANPPAWSSADEVLLPDEEAHLAAKLGADSFLCGDVSLCLRGERAYDRLVRSGLPPYVARPNPFTPLLDILAIGYVARRFDRCGFALVAERHGHGAAIS